MGIGGRGTAERLSTTAHTEAVPASGATSAGFDERASKDAAIVARLRGGDESAFGELIGELYPPMVRLARTIVGADSAGEVVQDTWAAALDGLDRFEGRASLKTWIFRILTNRAKTALSRSKRAVPVDWMTD